MERENARLYFLLSCRQRGLAIRAFLEAVVATGQTNQHLSEQVWMVHLPRKVVVPLGCPWGDSLLRNNKILTVKAFWLSGDFSLTFSQLFP